MGSQAPGSRGQVRLSTNLMFLPLTCPFAEMGNKTLGAQASKFTKPPHPPPSNLADPTFLV